MPVLTTAGEVALSYAALVPDPHSAVCPHCRQRAPIVLRGVEARCTVCGGRRLPFGARALNLTGSAARVGGGAARFFGWATIVIGLAFAAGLGLLLQTFFPGGFAGLAVALPIAIISLFFGIALVVGGGKLRQSGVAKRRAAEIDTIQALAAHQRGVVRATDAARALGKREIEADALLTDLARDPERGVSLDLDDDGNVLYLFGGPEQSPRWRIDAPPEPIRRDLEQAEWEQAEFEAGDPVQRTRR